MYTVNKGIQYTPVALLFSRTHAGVIKYNNSLILTYINCNNYSLANNRTKLPLGSRVLHYNWYYTQRNCYSYRYYIKLILNNIGIGTYT